jgi:hypothetical protein
MDVMVKGSDECYKSADAAYYWVFFVILHSLFMLE